MSVKQNESKYQYMVPASTLRKKKLSLIDDSRMDNLGLFVFADTILLTHLKSTIVQRLRA